MGTFKSFEEIEAWQLAREICRDIYSYTQRPPFSKDFEFRGQARRSSGSMVDNIAEGFERDGNKESKQFLSIGKGSSGELRSLLYRAMDNGYITPEEFDAVKSKTLRYGKMTAGLIRHLKASTLKGQKFKTKP